MNLQLSTPTSPGLAAARVPADAFAHRGLASSLLSALIAADPDAASDRVVVADPRGLPSTWARTGAAPCALCLRTRTVLTGADAPGERAEFCPECWTLDLYESNGAHVAHASAWLERLILRSRRGATATAPRTAAETTSEPPASTDPGEPS